MDCIRAQRHLVISSFLSEFNWWLFNSGVERSNHDTRSSKFTLPR